MYHATPIGDAEGQIVPFSTGSLDETVRACVDLAKEAHTRGYDYDFVVVNDDGLWCAIVDRNGCHNK